MKPRIPTAIILVALICIGPAAESGATTYDLLIRGARVLDGTGNPWFAADVAVEQGRIAAVGQLTGARARRVIEAEGLYLTPGFIDIHSHADDGSAKPGGARLRGLSLDEADLLAFAAQPWVATATDGGIAVPADGPVHPRYYGTFPRKLRRYAMELGVQRLEDAVRSATSLPATILGLGDRGLVRAGFHADLVLLDPRELQDRATFFDPHQPPTGIRHVLVNGRFVVEDGQVLYTTPGRVIIPSSHSSQ